MTVSGRIGRFWVFQAIFWLIAGLALFVSGATQMPVFQALVRNIFLLLAGFLSSFFLAMMIDQLRYLSLPRLRTASYASAYLIAMLSVVTINAITFTLRGAGLSELTFGQWFSGTLNFALVFAFWSELFIQRAYFDAPNDDSSHRFSNQLLVEHRGGQKPVLLSDILYVSAAGDYVEVHTSKSAFLGRYTLTGLEKSLDQRTFCRVHRSILINRTKVSSVRSVGRGRYRLELENGSSIASSRGYQQAIKQTFLASAA